MTETDLMHQLAERIAAEDIQSALEPIARQLGRELDDDPSRPKSTFRSIPLGLYGGLPFEASQSVARLSLPVVQTVEVGPGETVGYGASWVARRPSRIATVAGGYADGILRSLSGKPMLFHGRTACPLVGRVSMDLLTVDITHLGETPETLDLLCEHQSVDQLAAQAGTIGYEILTSLGARYARHYS